MSENRRLHTGYLGTIFLIGLLLENSCLFVHCAADTVRGEMWLRLSGCQNDSTMMDAYRTLLGKECPNEDIILRDITRTFPANDYFRESGGGQELLYKISKGYAVYDTEVGYCQGISFIAAALLLQVLI